MAYAKSHDFLNLKFENKNAIQNKLDKEKTGEKYQLC